MKLIPYERLKIKTSLRAEEALQRLSEKVEPKRFFRMWRPDEKPYQGEITGSTFKVTRIIRYRNSFLPIIKGEVQPEMGRSSVAITMQPHILVLIFMALWMVILAISFFFSLIDYISTIDRAGSSLQTLPETILASGGILLFSYLLFWGAFKFESVRSKKFFRELFQAEDVEEFELFKLNRE